MFGQNQYQTSIPKPTGEDTTKLSPKINVPTHGIQFVTSVEFLSESGPTKLPYRNMNNFFEVSLSFLCSSDLNTVLNITATR